MPVLPKLFLLFSTCLAFCAQAKVARFDFSDGGFRNTLYWVSDAPLEKTVGISHFLRGWVEIDPSDVSAHFKAEFEVDMRSFEMGPESKQVLWRQDVLNVAEHPGALFRSMKLEQVSSKALVSGKPLEARVAGTLNFRGQVQPCVARVRVVYHPETAQTRRRLGGNLLKVSAETTVLGSRWGVSIPKALVDLVAPQVQVFLDAVGTDGAGSAKK